MQFIYRAFTVQAYVMNQKEWKNLSKFEGKFEWYNRTRKIQKSLKYNEDQDAVVIHHLRDTEDQRNYNDLYYELWGHNLDGTFEYGKYVIFVTREQHTEIHKCSEETRQKMRENNVKSMLGKHHSTKTKHNISCHLKGIKRSNETKHKISMANKGKVVSEETKRKLSVSVSKSMTSEHRTFISQRVKESLTDEKRLANSIAQKERFANMSEEERSAFSTMRKEVSNRESVKLANSESHKALWQNEDYRNKQLEASKNRPPVSDETKEKCRQSSLRMWQDDAYRKKVSDALKVKGHTKEHDDKVRESRKQMSEDYKQYKTTGGALKWNDYQKWYKETNR